MPTTSNFGWTTPADTDLVKDGAAAIRTLGNGIDTSLVDLKGGTTGQVLSKASNTDLDFAWVAQDDSNAIQNALLTTTGDTIYASAASTPARLGIGSTGQVLTVSGGVPVWATPASPSFVGCLAYVTNKSEAMTGNVNKMFAFDNEEFDTDAFHSTTVNNSRITIPSGKNGKYLVNVQWDAADLNTGNYFICHLFKNGNAISNGSQRGNCGESGPNYNYAGMTYGTILDLVATDYLEFGIQIAGNITIRISGRFALQYLGA